MKTIICIVIIALCVGFNSCQKDEIALPTPSEMMTPQMMNNDSLDSPDDIGHEKSGNYILNAYSANQIPARFFSSGSSYKNKYIHVKQYTGECSWTSYDLCAGAIVNGNFGSYVYSVNHSKITSVKNWCGSSYVERLRDYANQMDNPFLGSYLSKEGKNSTGRFNTVKQMLNNLYTYQKPFIAIITNNNIGHYVVVWDIDWRAGVAGSTVYYTDPLDNPAGGFYSQRKSMDMHTFLDRMGPLNCYVSSYCALFLR